MAVFLTPSSSATSPAAPFMVAQETHAIIQEEGADQIPGAPATELLHTETGHAPAEEAKLPQLRFDSFPSQIFWLVVIFAALYVILQRSLLPRVHSVLENRANRIQQDLDRAGQYQQQATAARETFEKTQAEARLHAQTVMEEVQKRAKAAATQQQNSIDAQLRAQLAEADAAIDAARNAALKQAEGASATLADAIVKRVISLRADDTQERPAIRRAQ